MRKKISPLLTLSALSAALTLAGCGGGGGSSAPASGSTASAAAPDQTVTVFGSAAKGTIKNARVRLIPVAADGTKGAAVATTVTGGDGTFTAQVPANVVLLSIEVDGSAGGTFTDEISGQDLPIPALFVLRNVAHLGAPGVTKHFSSVTPFTEMIAQTAETTAGGLNAANLDAARAGFAAAFGFDAESVKPIDSTKDAAGTASDDEKQQSLLLTAVAKIAADSKLGCTAAEAGARIACVVKAIGKIGAVGTDGNLTLDDNLRKIVRQALEEVVVDTRLNHTGKTTVAGTASFAQSVLPTRAGGVSGIQGAKNLFASLRNNGNSVDLANKSGALSAQVASLHAEFSTAVAPVDRTILKWGRMLPVAIDFYNDYKSGATTAMFQYVASGSDLAGKCSITYSSANSAQVPANAVGVNCSTFYPTYLVSSTGVRQQASDSVAIVQNGDANSFKYSTRAYLTSYPSGQAPTFMTIGTYGDKAVGTGTINYVKDISAGIEHFAISGAAPARFDRNAVALNDHDQVDLVVDRKDKGEGLFEYAFSGDITSIKNGVADGALHVNPGSIIHYQDMRTSTQAMGLRDAAIDVTFSAGTSKIGGKLVLSGAQADKTGANIRPTQVGFDGSVATSSGEVFKGKVYLQIDGYGQYDPSLPDSASNFTPVTFTFDGALALPNRRPVTLMVNAAKPSLISQTIKAQYQDGDEVVQIMATDANIGVTPRAFQISTADGVEIDVVAGASTANVVKSGEVVAVVDISGGKINYKDGAFESLK